MSGSNGIKRYNGVEQDDEGAYVYHDEHIAALRRAKAEGMREAGKIARANAELLRPPSRQFELNMVNKAKSEEAGMIADELDARAAQIEEGA
jgi:hypothetical protein